MSVKHIVLKINDKKETLDTFNIEGGRGGNGAKGKALHIPAKANVHYELTDEATQFGPENIATKRSGKDLWITFEGGDIEQPDLIIEGYFGDDGQLGYAEGESNLIIGQHENGKYYPYVPESAQQSDAISLLADNAQAGQALGGEEVAALWLFNPLWLLALLPVIAIAASGGGDDKKEPAPELPNAVNDKEQTEVGKPVEIDILVNDGGKSSPIDPTTVVIVKPPVHGKVTVDKVTGKVTYTPDPSYKGPDEFTYTVKDKNGKPTNEAKVIIDVIPQPPSLTIPNDNQGEAGSDTQVVEDKTVNGSFTVTAPDGLVSITVGGKVLTAAELATLKDVPVVISTDEGDITLVGFNPETGEVSYSYNPKDDHKDHSQGDVIDHIPLVVTDKTGTEAKGTLDVLITDTAPTANADVIDLVETGSATGNLISGDGGATADDLNVDGPAVGGWLVGVVAGKGTDAVAGGLDTVIKGTYGDLVLQADGSFKYTPNDAAKALNKGETGQDVFTYTIEDSDGDKSTTTATFNVAGESNGSPTVTPPTKGKDGTQVPEDKEVDGSFTVTAPDGLVSITVGDKVLTAAELATLKDVPVVISTDEGDITLVGFNPETGEVSYSYNPKDDHKDHSQGDVIDHIPLVVTDKTGTEAKGTLDVLITDTAPIANADVIDLVETGSATGNLISGDGGATADDLNVDGPAVGGWLVGVVAGKGTDAVAGGLDTVIKGTYGDLVLQADGSFKYTPNDAAKALNKGETGQDVFTYTIEDSDGDKSTTTATFNVAGESNGIPTVVIPNDNQGKAGSDTQVPEDKEVDGSFTVTAPDGLVSITVGGKVLTAAELATLKDVPVVISTDEGDITLVGFNPETGEVSYSYNPKDDHKDHSQGDVIDHIPLVVTDKTGTEAKGTLDVLITDTAPIANADVIDLVETGSATGNLISGDGGATADDLNVDGPAVGGWLVGVVAGKGTDAVAGGLDTVIKGTYGDLVLQADGSFKYTPNDAAKALNKGKTGQDVFTYTIEDSDGDKSTTTATFNVAGTVDVPVLVNKVVVSEEGLTNGIKGSGTTDEAVAKGVVTILNSEGKAITDIDLTLQLPTETITSGGQSVVWSVEGQVLTGATPDGKPVMVITVGEPVVVDGKVEVPYTVELKAPVDHEAPRAGVASEENTLDIGFVLGSGDTATAVTVTVEDDAPVANSLTETVEVANTFYANVLISLDVSSSMAERDTNVSDEKLDPWGRPQDKMRYDVALDAVDHMLAAYQERLDAVGAGNGDVRVNISAFAEGATHISLNKGSDEYWVSLADARKIIDGLRNGDLRPDAKIYGVDTNYDAALQEVVNTYVNPGKTGPISAKEHDVENIFYFMSDGEPNWHSGTRDEHGTIVDGAGTTGIAEGFAEGYVPGNQRTEIGEADWMKFLTEQNIKAIAIGMGKDMLADGGQLKPIAYDGLNGVNNDERDAIVIKDMSKLEDVLLSSVPGVKVIYSSLTKDVPGEISSGFGADGGHVFEVTVDGNTYTYHFKNNEITTNEGNQTTWSHTGTGVVKITTSQGGIFELNMAPGDQLGQYSYTPASSRSEAGEVVDEFTYTFMDKDGDKASSTLTIDLSALPVKPSVNGLAKFMADDAFSELAIFNDTNDVLADFVGAPSVAPVSAGGLSLAQQLDQLLVDQSAIV